MTRRAICVVAAFVVVVGVAWWLFGFSVYGRGTSKIVLHRFFGRVTRVDSVTAIDGRMRRDRLLFRWSEPFTPGLAMTDCGAIYPDHWQDRNNDGNWDTWLKRVGPDSAGRCTVEYQVDTTGSGKPDWTFHMAYRESKKADELIRARRGF